MATLGKPLTLSADFESKPTPEVKWFRNGAEIAPSDKRVINIYENTAELFIPEVTKKDGGKYEVRVENPAGEARSSGSVTVKDKVDKTDEVKAPRFVEPIQPQIDRCWRRSRYHGSKGGVLSHGLLPVVPRNETFGGI